MHTNQKKINITASNGLRCLTPPPDRRTLTQCIHFIYLKKKSTKRLVKKVYIDMMLFVLSPIESTVGT